MGNMNDESIQASTKTQLQILLHRHYANSDSAFCNPFGHTMEALQQEAAKIITISKRTVKEETKPDPPTPPPPMVTSHEDPSKIYITVDKDTKDLAIDKMSYLNSCQEIFRLSRHNTSISTMDNLNAKDGLHLKKDLKKIRDELLACTDSPSREFIITASTTDSTIQGLSREQMVFSINKFASDRMVIADVKAITNLTKMQLMYEMRQVRDIIKSGSKEISILTLVRTKDGDTSQKELTQNLCGADITNFDTKNPKNDKTRLLTNLIDENDGYNAASTKHKM